MHISWLRACYATALPSLRSRQLYVLFVSINGLALKLKMALCLESTMAATVQNSDLADTTSRILAITVTASDVDNDRCAQARVEKQF